MPDAGGEPLLLAVVLWARDGRAPELADYEDEVLRLLPDHRGRVVARQALDGRSGDPTEVQLVEFADEAGYRAYLADPRRLALAGRRDAAILRTAVVAVPAGR